MEIVYRSARCEYELEVGVDPAVPVGRLAAVLAPRESTDDGGLVVDGLFCDPASEVGTAFIARGAVVEVAKTPPAVPIPPVVVLRAVAGLDAGWSAELREGRHLIGRDPACDVVVTGASVSRRHATLCVAPGPVLTIETMSEHSLTAVDDQRVTTSSPLTPGAMLRLGMTALTVELPGPVFDPLSVRGQAIVADGTVAFNRPPVTHPRDAPRPPLAIPSPPTPRERQPLSILTVFIPAVFAVVSSLAFHQLDYLYAGLLTPLAGVAAWLDLRRRARVDALRQQSTFDMQLQALDEGLETAGSHVASELRRRHPDLGELARWVKGPGPRLWERRRGQDDFGRLAVGWADVPWDPDLDDQQWRTRRDVPEAVRTVLDRRTVLQRVPVTIAGGGSVTGVTGEREPALALIRGLVCQAALLHSPADLALAVLASDDHARDWDWAKWLPHSEPGTVMPGWDHMLAAGPSAVSAMLGALEAAVATQTNSSRTLFVVVDDATLGVAGDLVARRARALVRDSAVTAVVLTPSRDRLVACSAVVEVRESGPSAVDWPDEGRRTDRMLPWGLEESTARRVARGLARFRDPDVVRADADLPDRARLSDVEGTLDPLAVSARWSAHRMGWEHRGVDRRGPPFSVPVGVGMEGPVTIDLAADGPHVVVCGTTGSGKSELLRALVLAMAVSIPMDDIVFALFDLSGGPTFDVLGRLPHSVGLLAGLGGSGGTRTAVAERMLACLEAELRHRRGLLDGAGAGDWTALRLQRGADPPVPRLVVVVDELAAGDQLARLGPVVGQIARDGRRLGVHLLVATHDPVGVLSSGVRSNANVWICLRVRDPADSAALIGVPTAATLSHPGRALVRVGSRPPVALQVPDTSAVATPGLSEPVTLRPFLVESLGASADEATEVDPDAPALTEPEGLRSEAERIVETVVAAFAADDAKPPRSPFPAPLPDLVTAEDLAKELVSVDAQTCEKDSMVYFALGDDPDTQRRFPVGWDMREGPLLLVGGVGSGTTNALAEVALRLVAGSSSDAVHLYVIDCGAADLAPLTPLVDTGTYIARDDAERQVRLVRLLGDEVLRRRTGGSVGEKGSAPTIVVLIDGLDVWARDLARSGHTHVTDDLLDVACDGAPVGVTVACTAHQLSWVPDAWLAAAHQQFLLDPPDHGPMAIPGRAVEIRTGKCCQIAWSGPPARAVEALGADGPGRAPAIDALPKKIDLASTTPVGSASGGDWVLPLGLGDRRLEPVGLHLAPFEHALVVGRAGSGRSTTLATLAAATRTLVLGAQIVIVADKYSSLADFGAADTVLDGGSHESAALLEATASSGGPLLLLLDDVERLASSVDEAMAPFLRTAGPNVHIVASGLPTAFDRPNDHWTTRIRSSHCGVVLRPDQPDDGALLGVVLPPSWPVPPSAGRGYLVADGEIELVQVASPHLTNASTPGGGR